MTTPHGSLEQDFIDVQTEQLNDIANNVSPGAYVDGSDSEDDSSNTAVEVDPDLYLINHRRFHTQQYSVGALHDMIHRSEVELNPPHQRNESIHNDAWKSELILSNIVGMPLGEPEFDTKRMPNGTTVLRSP